MMQKGNARSNRPSVTVGSSDHDGPEYGFRRAPWHDIETTTTPTPELLDYVSTAQSILDTLRPAMKPRPS